MSVTVEHVRGVLKTIFDPEIHLSIAIVRAKNNIPMPASTTVDGDVNK